MTMLQSAGISLRKVTLLRKITSTVVKIRCKMHIGDVP